MIHRSRNFSGAVNSRQADSISTPLVNMEMKPSSKSTSKTKEKPINRYTADSSNYLKIQRSDDTSQLNCYIFAILTRKLKLHYVEHGKVSEEKPKWFVLHSQDLQYISYNHFSWIDRWYIYFVWKLEVFRFFWLELVCIPEKWGRELIMKT